MNHPAIEVSGLVKDYPGGNRALTDVSFSVKAAESVVLLGANASGKSTLLKCLTRLIEPTAGSVRVLETDVINASRRQLAGLRAEVGVVFQRINLVRELSVISNVIHGSLGRVKSPRNWFAATAYRQQREEAMEALDRVGLAHVAERRAEQLSGGQQQRVAIARMLIQRPQVVLADEPVAALDPYAGRAVMDLLWEITQEQRLTLICTLHQLHLARAYGHRVLALRGGQVELNTTMGEVADEQLEGLYTDDETHQSHGRVNA